MLYSCTKSRGSITPGVGLRLLVMLLAALTAQAADPACGAPGEGSRGWIDNNARRCTIAIESSQVAEVRFDGGDRDLKLEVLDRAGAVVRVIDTRETGPELVIVTDPNSGIYAMQLRAVESRREATPYLMQVRVRAVDSKDNERVAAESVMTEARQLALKDGSESQTAAFSAFDRASALWRRMGDRESQAAALLGAGTALHYLARHEQAASTFTQALEAAEGIDAEWIQAECLNNLGISLWQIGSLAPAIDRYEQALTVLRKIGHRRGESAALSNLGIIHREMGEYDKARQYYGQALPITREIGEPSAEAFVRSNLGVVLSFLGQRSAAIASLTKARRLFGISGNVRAQARALVRIAEIELSSRSYEAADRDIRAALPLIERSGDQRSRGAATVLTARLLEARGRRAEALATFQRAADLYRGARLISEEASVFHALGELAARARDYPTAEKYLQQALDIRRDMGLRDAEAETLYRIASLKRASRDFDAARKCIQEALRLTEEVRELVSGSQFRMSYLSSKHDYYELAVNIEVDLNAARPARGFDRSAFEVSERARTRTLLDTLNANYQTPAVQSLRSRMRDLQRSLRFWSYRLSEDAAAGATKERLAATRAHVDQTLADSRNLQSDIAAAARDTAEAITGPLNANQIQSKLRSSSTTLIQYFVGEERSLAWLVTGHSLEMFRLPRRAVIEQRAQQFYAATMRHDSESIDRWFIAAQALSAGILPARMRFPVGRLVIAPDGVLHQIPIASLPHLARSPLLAQYQIAVVPSVSSVFARRTVQPEVGMYEGALAVVADPVFDASDMRVRTVSAAARKPQYRRLSYTAREARTIAALAPESRRRISLGFQAAPSLFFNGEITRFRHLHVATHAVTNREYPELSSLVFSLVDQSGRPVDGYLRASDIELLSLRADLVTLSACGTGLGAQIRGEGPLSLARAFLTAGAHRVLVSLWSVQDDATAELMAAFYRRLFASTSVSPATAFREAQMELRKRPGREHPFYWAGWVLVGDWQ